MKIKKEVERVVRAGKDAEEALAIVASTQLENKGQNETAQIAAVSGETCAKTWSEALNVAQKCMPKCEQLNLETYSAEDRAKCKKDVDLALGEIDGGKANCEKLAAGGKASAESSASGDGKNPAGAGMDIGNALSGLAAGMVSAGLFNGLTDKKDEDNSCLGPKAFKKSECTEVMIATCANNMSDPKCQKFGDRYCKVDGGGEGVGTPFCRASIATGFCKVEGRSQCPSCLLHAANTSPACIANPTLCLGQNSPEQMEAAKQSCPTDPMFSDPNYAVAQYPSSSTSTAVSSGSGMGVASIGAQFGPSLFSMSSEAIRKRCAKGLLPNCTAR